MARFDLDESGRDGFAFRDGVLAAGVEMAAGRRIDRGWDVAFQDDPLAFGFDFGVGNGNG